MNRIIGQLIEGFGTRIIAAGLALFVAYSAGETITRLLADVTTALVSLP